MQGISMSGSLLAYSALRLFKLYQLHSFRFKVETSILRCIKYLGIVYSL